MDGQIGIGSTDTKKTVIQTSQAQNGGWSLTEGKSGGSVGTIDVYGDEKAPTGVSTKVAMSGENQLKTTQQIAGAFSLCEGK